MNDLLAEFLSSLTDAALAQLMRAAGAELDRRNGADKFDDRAVGVGEVEETPF